MKANDVSIVRMDLTRTSSFLQFYSSLNIRILVFTFLKTLINNSETTSS